MEIIVATVKSLIYNYVHCFIQTWMNVKHPMEIVLKCALITMAPSHAPVKKDFFWQRITWDVMVSN